MTVDGIKTELFKKYKKEIQTGIFFSLFDRSNKLLASNGVLETDKSLNDLLDIMYTGIIMKYPGAKTIVADVVKNLTPQSDITTFMTLSPKEHGIFMINKTDNKSWVLLPNVVGVNDMKSAITFVKQRFWLSGTVEIYTFKTEKTIIIN